MGEPFRLAAGYSLVRLPGGDVRLIHYPADHEQIHIDIPAARWIDAIHAMADSPPDGWEEFKAGEKIPEAVNAQLVHAAIARIHLGRHGR